MAQNYRDHLKQSLISINKEIQATAAHQLAINTQIFDHDLALSELHIQRTNIATKLSAYRQQYDALASEYTELSDITMAVLDIHRDNLKARITALLNAPADIILFAYHIVDIYNCQYKIYVYEQSYKTASARAMLLCLKNGMPVYKYYKYGQKTERYTLDQYFAVYYTTQHLHLDDKHQYALLGDDICDVFTRHNIIIPVDIWNNRGEQSMRLTNILMTQLADGFIIKSEPSGEHQLLH